MSNPRPGWYVDPKNKKLQRFWDGAAWQGEPKPSERSTRAFPFPSEQVQPLFSRERPASAPGPELVDPFERRVVELLAAQERHQRTIANLLAAMLAISVLVLVIWGIVLLAHAGPK